MVDVDVDETLGERVALEMKRNDWSYGEIAAQMTNVGCPISKTALHRVVNGNPSGERRPLAAREMVALAAVLGVDIADLLTPIDLLEKQRAQNLFHELEDSESTMWRAAARLYNAKEELKAMGEEQPELSKYIENRIRALGLKPFANRLIAAANLPRPVALKLSEVTLAMSGISRNVHLARVDGRTEPK